MKTILLAVAFGSMVVACGPVDGIETVDHGDAAADAGDGGPNLVCREKCGTVREGPEWNANYYGACLTFCEPADAPECSDKCVANSYPTDGGKPGIVCGRFCGSVVVEAHR